MKVMNHLGDCMVQGAAAGAAAGCHPALCGTDAQPDSRDGIYRMAPLGHRAPQPGPAAPAGRDEAAGKPQGGGAAAVGGVGSHGGRPAAAAATCCCHNARQQPGTVRPFEFERSTVKSISKWLTNQKLHAYTSYPHRCMLCLRLLRHCCPGESRRPHHCLSHLCVWSHTRHALDDPVRPVRAGRSMGGRQRLRHAATTGWCWLPPSGA